ncbi:ABC transporter permease subunit [Streptomyces sp. PLK6-54]|uniref:ABC transporter permease subunit n=1 Tax=Actinacidiphila acidipaludis TaxID=2873382 RepID=A0ABS7QAL5_9ACTN|nr:ABC transporter permease subunit [Streptomyces acidipaludis]
MLRAVRAEWAKLRSVRSTAAALLATVALVVLIGVLTAEGGHTSYGGPARLDAFAFVHRPATGDVSVTAEVTAQADSAPWAKAGLMLKSGTGGGSPSVSLMLTPDHGVRLQARGTTELTGSGRATAPYWLRLTRSGHRVTGWESADGRTWRAVGTVADTGLPATAEAGMFVASPPVGTSHWAGPGKVVGRTHATTGRAVFDHVTAGASGGGAWRLTDVTQPPGPPGPQPEAAVPGGLRQDGGVFTVTGGGDLGSPGVGGIGQDGQDDTVASTLGGVQIGLFAVVALGVLAMTSEYRTRTIRTTFTVSPHRGRVLAAKALVVAGGVFAAGLAACTVSFLVARPIQRRNGYGPPIFPQHSLTDPPVLRAVIGTAAFLALVALLSLAVGVIVRRTAAAVILLFTVLVVIPLVAQVTSVGAGLWVGRATPIAGAAIRQTQPLFEDATGPWQGFAVMAAYTAAALGAAFWLQRRRDA